MRRAGASAGPSLLHLVKSKVNRRYRCKVSRAIPGLQNQGTCGTRRSWLARNKNNCGSLRSATG
jgi:hypothetical protein